MNADEYEQKRSIEVGNIFSLGARFSDAFGLTFKDADGRDKPIFMGCYGIGSSRLMGAIVECLHDERGMIWPRQVAPFQVHLLSLARDEADLAKVNQLFRDLTGAGVEVLFDDRRKPTAGSKLAAADLIGLPYRVVVSPRTLADGEVEVQKRTESESIRIPIDGIVEWLRAR